MCSRCFGGVEKKNKTNFLKTYKKITVKTPLKWTTKKSKVKRFQKNKINYQSKLKKLLNLQILTTNNSTQNTPFGTTTKFGILTSKQQAEELEISFFCRQKRFFSLPSFIHKIKIPTNIYEMQKTIHLILLLSLICLSLFWLLHINKKVHFP